MRFLCALAFLEERARIDPSPLQRGHATASGRKEARVSSLPQIPLPQLVELSPKYASPDFRGVLTRLLPARDEPWVPKPDIMRENPSWLNRDHVPREDFGPKVAAVCRRDEMTALGSKSLLIRF